MLPQGNHTTLLLKTYSMNDQADTDWGLMQVLKLIY